MSPYKKTIGLSCKMVVHGFIIISNSLSNKLCFESVYVSNTVSQNLTKNLMKYQTLIFFLATLVTLCETLRKCHVVLELLLHQHSVKNLQLFCWKYFFFVKRILLLDCFVLGFFPACNLLKADKFSHLEKSKREENS